ncbi:hypothetical protein BT96DRAFT_996599 [Gymnopus androsaceus JB14]|uniref:DUF6534 domain-containing protein n=1 Tax=Gymnopus androsaceus JB14 TaxID=1447944 RepID=A0A6A4HFH3_9AGAR|nr:hypothetical protein BT96DRAFT_996599 [Gymnopus androsaceus JB14]
MAAAIVTVSPEVTIDNTLGALFVGFADKPIYKFVVVLILLLETADQVFIGQIYYYYGISNFSNPLTLVEGTQTWSFILQQMLGSVVGTIVKIAFGMRVWRFSERNFFITGIIMILSLGGLVLAIVFSVKSFMLPNVFSVVKLRVLGTTTLGVGMLTDIITALSLCYFLNRLRTGYHQSDTLVLLHSLPVEILNSDLVDRSVVSVATVVLYNVMPSNLIFIAVYFILSKLYAISFMATLNTRRVIRGRGTDKQGTTTESYQHVPLGNEEGWEAAYTTSKPEFEVDPENAFPLNTFAPPTLGKAYYAQ